MVKLKRPLVRYHGGKWKLADWIISHFPEHRVFTEVFGGGASVLLKKPRAYAEVYNDLDGEIVNLFRVARDDGEELRRRLELTPFSRSDFEQAWFPCECPIEQARRTVIRSFMGFGSAAVTMARETSRKGKPGTGFRSTSNRSGTTPAPDWRNYPGEFGPIIERLRGVVIENRQAAQILLAHDGPETLHYVDPPYVAASRDAGHDYAHEMTDGDHVELSATLHKLKGSVILSGYHSELYDGLYSDWRRVERAALADGAAARVEVLWLSPNCRVTQGGLDL